jgi:trimeric autotransporter adhesin
MGGTLQNAVDTFNQYNSFFGHAMDALGIFEPSKDALEGLGINTNNPAVVAGTTIGGNFGGSFGVASGAFGGMMLGIAVTPLGLTALGAAAGLVGGAVLGSYIGEQIGSFAGGLVGYGGEVATGYLGSYLTAPSVYSPTAVAPNDIDRSITPDHIHAPYESRIINQLDAINAAALAAAQGQGSGGGGYSQDQQDAATQQGAQTSPAEQDGPGPSSAHNNTSTQSPQTDTPTQDPNLGIPAPDVPAPIDMRGFDPFSLNVEEPEPVNINEFGPPGPALVANIDSLSINYANLSDMQGNDTNGSASNSASASDGVGSGGLGGGGGFGGDGGGPAGGSQGNGSGNSSDGSSGASGSEGGDGNGSSGGDAGGSGGEGGGSPILIDLDGNGIKLWTKNEAAFTFDFAGDGYQHRTAWAGAGDAILAYDADNDGKITEREEVAFSNWDAGASSDMEALARIFDSNKNGKLDSGDAGWARFRAVVTNADGTTSVKTLNEVGIASLSLIQDRTALQFKDGSSIEGQSTFTRTNGTTGITANATFATDAQGYAVRSQLTANADGSKTLTKTFLTAEGAMAQQTVQTTSANGQSITLRTDKDGDGLSDEILTRVQSVPQGGGSLEMLTLSNMAGRVLSSTKTTTSADGKTVTILHDNNGDGWSDISEARGLNVSGVSMVTTSELSRTGAVLDRVQVEVSASGQTRTTRLDSDGNGAWETIAVDNTITNTNGTRTREVITRNADNSIRARDTLNETADGRSRDRRIDVDGDGTTDSIVSTFTSVNAAGDASTGVTQKDRAGGILSSTSFSVTGNGLVEKASRDIDGNGSADWIKNNSTTLNSDGSRTQVVEIRNGDNSLQMRETVLKNSDGRSRTVSTDTDGNGQNERVAVISVNAAGLSTTSIKLYADNGALLGQTVMTTSADNKTRTIQSDVNADGFYDTTIKDQVIINANSSSTATRLISNADNSSRSKLDVITTANGLGITTRIDSNGDGVNDATISDITTQNADGSKVQVIATSNTNGFLRERTTINTSADRQTMSRLEDVNGDAVNDQITIKAIQANGDEVTTREERGAGNVLLTRSIETASGNGLTQKRQIDANGDGVYEATLNKTSVLNINGSRVITETSAAANGALREKTVTTTNASGLRTTIQTDGNGDGFFETTSTSVTSIANDGSRTTTLSEFNRDGTLRDRAATTLVGNTLQSTTRLDLDGNGTTDRTVINTFSIAANGTKAQETTTLKANGTLRAHSVAAVSDDGQSQFLQHDADGDGYWDFTRSISVLPNGESVTTDTNLNDNGQSVMKGQTIISGNGLSQTLKADRNGDGVYDDITTRIVTLANDGSQTVTTTLINSDGSIQAKTLQITSATGLTRTTKMDINGDNVVEASTLDQIILNANGSTTRTISTTNANGSLRARDIILTSDDGETIANDRDQDGDGFFDLKDVVSIQANRDTLETHSIFAINGALLAKTIETTSLNGFSWSFMQDLNGDGANDRVFMRSTALVSDGSSTTTFKDTAFAGGTPTLKSQIITTTNLNGWLVTEKLSALGPNWAPQIFTYDTSTTKTFNSNGSISQVFSAFMTGTATLKHQVSALQAANGLSSSITFNTDGTGGFEREQTSVVTVDGDRSDILFIKATTGALAQKMTSSQSSDGKSSKTSLDLNGDGFNDRTTSFNHNSDGSSVLLVNTLNTNGAVKSAAAKHVSADGLNILKLIDVDGDGFKDYGQTSITTLLANGSTVTTSSLLNNQGALLEKTVSTSSDDGFSKTTQWDTDGNGITDKTTAWQKILNPDGTITINSETFYADSSLRSRFTEITSANGKSSTYQSDDDGNGFIDRKLALIRNADDTLIQITTFYTDQGQVQATKTTMKSADGLKTQISWSDGTEEAKEYVAEAYGSYTWTYNALTGASSSSAHVISHGGVETWSLNENSTIYSATLDTLTKYNFIEQAKRIYDVVLNRQMNSREEEFLVKYWVNGVLDSNKLAFDLLTGTEFTQRFSVQTNAQFVDRIYTNGFDRTPLLKETEKYLSSLSNGLLTKAQIVQQIAESSEYFSLAKEIPIMERSPELQNLSLDKPLDKAIVLNQIARLYDAAYDRAPSTAESNEKSQLLLSGTKTVFQIASDLIASSEFLIKNGVNLSNSDFINNIFLNSLGYLPTISDNIFWANSLTNNQISRSDLLYLTSETPEHSLNAISVAYGTTANDTLMGDGNSNKLFGLDGTDILIGGAGFDLLDGGNGADIASYISALSSIVIDQTNSLLNTGDAAGDTLVFIEQFQLSNFNDKFVGNASNETIFAGAGDDIIMGGAGLDQFWGQYGEDVFYYANKLEGGDTIFEFVTGTDHIQISASDFGGGLVSGVMDTNRLITGTGANQNFGQFIINGASLWWDSDGIGAGDASLIANFVASTMPTFTDFIVI